jgi:hypothetical protein
MTMTRNALRLLALTFLLHGLCAPPAEARRVALVIGNADYRIGPLANPLNDAGAVAEAFEKHLKFEKVILRRNLNGDAFRAALRELARETSGAEIGVVYFAGHGIEVAGRNYLIPTDAALAAARDIDLEAIALDTVLGQLDGVRKLKLVVLDACRNNPFAVAGGKRSVTRGLARIEPESNTLIAYAAKDGTTAEDGTSRHSPFTTALLKRLATPSLDVRRLFGYVSDDVMAATNRTQEPYLYGRLGGEEVYLTPAALKAEGPPPAGPLSAAALEWSRVDRSSIVELETFEHRHPTSTEAEYARARLGELKKHAVEASLPLEAPGSGAAGKPANKPGSVGKRAATPLARVALQGVVGPPDALSRSLHQELATALGKRSFDVRAGHEDVDYGLRPYILATKERAGTKVSYVLDITDPTGKRLGRFPGEEVTGPAADPWAAVSATLVQSLAAKVAGGFEGWLAREGRIVLVFPTASGAPGDGNAALAAAMKRALSGKGFAPAEIPTAYMYRVEGSVTLGLAREGKQPLRIDWVTKDPRGKRLKGTVIMKNEIPEGSLDGAWGHVADYVAQAAVNSLIQNVLPQPKR